MTVGTISRRSGLNRSTIHGKEHDLAEILSPGAGRVLDDWRNPKPSAAAFSALRTFIPGKYEYLGTANLGPKHMVQIVKADGKVVALAYKIRKDGPDLEIDDENEVAKSGGDEDA